MLLVGDQLPGTEVGVGIAVAIGVGVRVGFRAANAVVVVLGDSTVLISTMHRSAATDPNLILFIRIIRTS
jgi:hypothetical protein